MNNTQAVLWPSVLNEDPWKKDTRTSHAALPVIKRVKYAANHWIHSHDFQIANHWRCTGAYDSVVILGGRGRHLHQAFCFGAKYQLSITKLISTCGWVNQLVGVKYQLAVGRGGGLMLMKDSVPKRKVVTLFNIHRVASALG
jgi:hypothetical protein